MNGYSVLSIPVDADDDAIRSAFHLLARRYHPDRGAGSSPERFRQIVEAYETLIDPARRRIHDLALRRASRPASPVPIEPLLPYPEPLYQSWSCRARRSSDLDDLLEYLIQFYPVRGWFWRR